MNSQNINYKEQALKKNSNFFEIVKKTRNQFLELKKKSKGLKIKKDVKARKQFERWVYAWKDKVNPDGSFPKKSKNEKEYLKLLKNQSINFSKSSTTKPWTQIGPSVNVEQNGYTAYPGLGRVNVVAVKPGGGINNNTIYAGSAAGGLWKSTDGGSTWSPKTDDLAGLGVSDIIIDPNNTNIIYMATGDEDAQHISSIGVYKSIDAGENWSVTGLSFSLNENEYIRDLSFAPGSSTTIFALTNNKIKKSTDSGNTWSNMITDPVNSDDYHFQTIIFDPNDSNKVVVSDVFGGIWYSTDGGNNFGEHLELFGNSENKLKLTTTANDNDHFYGITAEIRDDNENITTQGKFKKFRFAFNDTTADLISSTDITDFNSQHGYNQCIAVSPTDKNNIIIGGVRGYKSTDNGATFSVLLNPYNIPAGVGFYVHPDHHHLSFLEDGVTVINGHDGGVHKGLFSATTGWTDISNGLIITQPYNIAITQGLNGDDYMMGNQDNDGFSKVLKDGTQKWVACQAGDGTSVAIDMLDSGIRYLGGTNGSLNKTDDGYSSSFNNADEILPGVSDGSVAFVSPLALHPTIATTIYAGHGDVKKSTNRGGDGTNVNVDWTSLNSGLTETEFLDVSVNNNSTTTRIFAIGKVGATSTLKRSIDDGANWTTITNPAGVIINSVYAVPNTDVVYATVSSYTASKKVYKSVNNGDAWTNISDNLPNIIMYKIILDSNKSNETLYLATELGLYFTDNSTTNWTKLGTGLPNVRISDIKISKNNGNIYIGTFGRGLWVYNDQKYFDNVTDNNWSVTSNWEGKTIPSATDDVYIKKSENVTLNINSGAAKTLEIADGALLTIEKNSDLTIEDEFSSTSLTRIVKINSDANDSGVLIVKGTSTGKVEFERGGLKLNDWSLVSIPLEGQKIKSFAEDVNNNIRVNTTPDPDRFAIGYYDDSNLASNKWVYYDANIDANTTFTKTKGYIMSRSSDGSVSFIGTLLTDNQSILVSEDEWNAIGNPYTAYYPANKNSDVSFINDNSANLDSPAVYIWDVTQGKYIAITDLVSSTQRGIPPGQGFFVKTKTGVTNLSFNESNRITKPATGENVFNKTENKTPFIKLFAQNRNIEISTDVIYSKSATLGYDINEDIINFDSSNFDMTTQLLENNKGVNYTIQSIPNNDFENQIIPINLKAKSNEEIVFRASLNNLPEDLNVFLEDRINNSFVNLNLNDTYKIKTTEDLKNVGRFYLHLSRKSLVTDLNSSLDTNVFNINKELHVRGLNNSKLSVFVYDISGKLISRFYQKGNGKNKFNLDDLKTGIYVIKVNFENKSRIKKVILK